MLGLTQIQLIVAAGLLATTAVGAGGTLWYRGQWLECGAAREADRTAAEKAAKEAIQAAQMRSDAIITEQAQRLAETAMRANTVREKVIYAPVTTACASSPAVRAALDGLQSIAGPAGGGGAQAQRGAPAAVSGPARR